MTIEIDSVRIRLENIKRKCVQFLSRDQSWFSYTDHHHLFESFNQIRDVLQTQYPGAFVDIPQRELRGESLSFDEDDTYIGCSKFELLNDDIEDCLNCLSQLGASTPQFSVTIDKEGSIPEHLRRDVFDLIGLSKSSWHGRLSEVDFLRRLYKLDDLPSTDHRFTNATGDIWQHRILNEDWNDDWVFYDDRFGLLYGSDSTFLEFLCQMLHPVVREDASEVRSLVDLFNEHLSKAGWQLVQQAAIADRHTYGAVKTYSSLLRNSSDVIDKNLSTEYIGKLLNRMQASIDKDPELAIGSAKELVESVCKTVLNDRNADFAKDDNLQQLVKKTLKELKLDPDDMPPNTKAIDSIRPLLKSLATVSHMLAELRGQFGTGHGKDARTKGLGPRHAQLAVTAASGLAVFLFETHLERETAEKRKATAKVVTASDTS